MVSQAQTSKTQSKVATKTEETAEEEAEEEEEEEPNSRGLDKKRIRKYFTYDLKDLLEGGWAEADSEKEVNASGYKHNMKGTPDSDCIIYCMPLDEDSYCEYRSQPSGEWHACKYCEDIVKKFVAEQFDEFITAIGKADCKAELRRRLANGPPVWVADKDGLPIPDNDTHIDRFWCASTKKEYSARVVGSFVEGSRSQDKLWNKLSLVMTIPPEPVEGETFSDSEDEPGGTGSPTKGNSASVRFRVRRR
jgi:hypothetical protein